MEDGLPHTIVQAVAQTRDGYLWVGTREGLARFDGVRFTPLKFPGEVIQPSITCLCQGADGSVWAGTLNSGLFRWQRGKLSHYGRAEGLRNDFVTSLQADREGAIWISSSQGVARWEAGKFNYVEELGLGVWSLFLAEDGSLWLATNHGVKCLKHGEVTSYTAAEGLLANALKSVYRSRNGVLWLGAVSGLTRMQAETFTRYPKGTGPSAIVNAVFEDRGSNVWVGTYAGLSRLVDGEFIDATGGTSYKIYSIIQDREGSVWVGSEEGLMRFNPKRFTTYTRQQGLTHDKIASVCEGRDGSIWIGTWGGGVNQLKDGKVFAYTKTNGLASDYVYSLQEGRDGSLWIGLDLFDGLDRLKDGHVRHYGKEQGLAADAVTVIHEDRRGTLWLGTRSGLFRMQADKFVRCDIKDGSTHQRINALCDSRQGGLWIGTAGGLTQWSEGKGAGVTFDGTLFTHPVLSLYEDASGALWIGTHGNGLSRFKEGKLDAFSTKEGLPSDVIYAILEDDQKNLWLSSSKGIFEVAKSQLEQVASGKIASVKSVNYDRTDGILSSSQSTEVTQPAAWKAADGRLWFRTMQGILVTDPKRITKNELPPPVVIESVVANKKRIEDANARPQADPGGGREPASVPLPPSAQLRIPPGPGELEISYTALSLRASEKNRFKYKLQDVDADWVEAGTRRVAYYNHIAPGSYVFRVAACNNDGVWNEDGAEVALVLQPHFWQTGWFLSLCALVAAGGIGGTARYVTQRRMHRKLERLEQQHALDQERARIARDMHDDLGSSLANIVLMGEQLERDGKSLEAVKAQGHRMTGKVKQAIRVMDQIVWAVNPQNDSLSDLVSYLSDYAQSLPQPTSCPCRLEVADGLPAIPLTAHMRHDLFLAVKEALHNAAKHSRATEIWLRIQCIAGDLCVMVEDNGRGFEPDVAEAGGGHGLRNMRSRLAAIGGRVEIASQRGKGTVVRFTVGLAPDGKTSRDGNLNRLLSGGAHNEDA